MQIKMEVSNPTKEAPASENLDKKIKGEVSEKCLQVLDVNGNVEKVESCSDIPVKCVDENKLVFDQFHAVSDLQVQVEEFVHVIHETSILHESIPETDYLNKSPNAYTQLLDHVVVSDIHLQNDDEEDVYEDYLTDDVETDFTDEVENDDIIDEESDSIECQLKKLSLRMNKYEEHMKLQNEEIALLKETICEKDQEIEKLQSSNQDSNGKNRTKEKDKEVQSMKQELNRNRSLVCDLQMSVKQVHNQLKSIANNAFDFEDRLSDIEKLSPKMGVFEWRLENYGYHSQNSEYLCSPEFYIHLNGYCCYLSVQWFGNKNGRLGLYLHLDRKKNINLVESCKINMLIQCVGCFGLTKDHVVNYDFDDADSDSSIMELDDSIISGDNFFLLKPFLDKYLIEDCLYFYVHLLSDPCLEV